MAGRGHDGEDFRTSLAEAQCADGIHGREKLHLLPPFKPAECGNSTQLLAVPTLSR